MSASSATGVYIHAEGPDYDHAAFRPWRLQALALQGDPAALSRLPDLWRDFPYEYVFDKLAIDVINGGPALREWVDDAGAAAGRPRCASPLPDEAAWEEARAAHPALLITPPSRGGGPKSGNLIEMCANP